MLEGTIETLKILGKLSTMVIDDVFSLGLLVSVGLLVYCVISTMSGKKKK